MSCDAQRQKVNHLQTTILRLQAELRDGTAPPGTPDKILELEDQLSEAETALQNCLNQAPLATRFSGSITVASPGQQSKQVPISFGAEVSGPKSGRIIQWDRFSFSAAVDGADVTVSVVPGVGSVNAEGSMTVPISIASTNGATMTTAGGSNETDAGDIVMVGTTTVSVIFITAQLSLTLNGKFNPPAF